MHGLRMALRRDASRVGASLGNLDWSLANAGHIGSMSISTRRKKMKKLDWYSVKNSRSNHRPAKEPYQGMELIFFGTASGQPNLHRNQSSAGFKRALLFVLIASVCSFTNRWHDLAFRLWRSHSAPGSFLLVWPNSLNRISHL